MDTYLSSSIDFYNGTEQSHAPVSDRGFQYGDGLFESMLFERKSIPLMDFHQQRLLRSCERMGISLCKSRLHTNLKAVLNNPRVSSLGRAKVKVIVTRGEGGVGSYPPVDNYPNLFIQVSDLGSSSSRPICLRMASHALTDNPQLVGIKHLNRLSYIMACASVPKGSGEEILFFDMQRHVVETMHHNIFFVEAGKLLTPKIDSCGVAGVMRELIISRLAPENNIIVNEVDISVDRMNSFESCFLSNAVRGLVSVSKFDNHEYQPARVMSTLTRALENYKIEKCRDDL